MRLPQLLTGSCLLPHPQTRHGYDQVLGVASYLARLPTRAAESGSLAL